MDAYQNLISGDKNAVFPKKKSGLKSSDFRPLRINMRLFPFDAPKMVSMIYGVRKGKTVSILCVAIRIIQRFCPFCGQNEVMDERYYQKIKLKKQA